jgi:signal transduction histidine kinase
MTNVIRHAEASHVKIFIRESPNYLRLSIADNGKGMTPEKMSATTSLGILGMKERIAHLGGQVRISSSVGRGTRLLIAIPIGQS